MDDLTQFLRDRLADDEAFMRAAIRLRESGAIVSSPQATEGAFALADIVRTDPDTAQAIALFTTTGTRAPGEAERVLEEVSTKRQMLDEHADVNDGSCGTCVDGQWGYPTHGGSSPQQFPCRTLRLLGLPYADHPEYNESWRL